jgi:predicted site-specific integrase-resolvase
MITPEEAALILQTSTRTIYSWVEADLIHFNEQPGGSLLICPDSLPVD